jgi:hypothetical protein
MATTYPVMTNRIRAGGFVQSEANFARSRDKVTLEGGTGGAGVVYAGTVLGKVTSSGHYMPSPASGSDGSQTAVAILWDDADATHGDVEVAIVSRDAEVRAADLTYEATVDTDNEKAAKWTQLAAVGIIVRVADDTQST